MEILAYLLIVVVGIVIISFVLNKLSYSLLKKKIIAQTHWDLNICCGLTDGGGINADIMIYEKLPRMVMVDIYNLPFADESFPMVLSSHTIEHVDDPVRFWNELQRVGRAVTLVIPPLWDISAVLNLLEHKWIFLSFRKKHTTLPPFIRLPLASFIQRLLGQRLHA
ncbi:methyltransferase domain-containing protein [candidate division KSB1 bacterium]|nr:methyltransferase domain-containing protein [candidate division KSB1 bacterium]